MSDIDDLSPDEIADLVLNGECAGGALLQKLPRWDTTMQSVPLDWTELPVPIGICENETSQEEFVCPLIDQALGLNEEQAAEFEAGTFDFQNFALETLRGDGGGEDATWVHVAQSYGVYAGLCAALALLCFLFLILYILIKICCCFKRCVCKKKKIEPKGKVPEPRRTKYGTACQLMGIVALLVFILFIFSFMLLGHTRGNQGFTETQKVMATGIPVASAQLVSSVPPLISDTLNAFAGTFTVNVLERVNETLTETLDFGILSNATACIIATLDSISTSVLEGFFGIIETVDEALTDLPDKNTAVGQVETLNDTLYDLNDSLQNVSTFFDDLKEQLDALNLTLAAEAVSSLDAVLNTDVAPAIGDLKPSIVLLRDNIPTSTELGDTKTALEQFRDGPTSGRATTAKSNLDVIITKLNNLPEGVAAVIRAVQAVFTQASSDVEDIETTLTGINTKITALPDGTAINNTVQPLFELVNDLDLASIRTTMDAFGTIINEIPSGVGETVREIAGIADNLPCIMQLTGQVDNISENIVELPFNITEMLNEVNSTISSSVGSIESLATLFDDLDVMLNELPNMTSYVSIINETENLLETSIEDISLDGQLESLDSNIASIDLNLLLSKVADLRTELDAGIDVTDDQLTSLENLDTVKNATVGHLEDAKDSIETWENDMSPDEGRCVADDTKTCGPNESTSHCTRDQCSDADMRVKLQAAIESITAFEGQTSSLPDFASIVTGIEASEDAIQATPSLDATEINNFGDILADFSTDLGGYSSTLTSLSGTVTDTLTSLDLNSIKTSIGEAMDVLESVEGDLGEYNTTLVEFNSTIAEISGGSIGKTVRGAAEGLDILQELLFSDLEGILDLIRGDSISVEIVSNGFKAGVSLFTRAADQIISRFSSVAGLVMEGEDPEADQGNQTQVLADFLAGHDDTLNQIDAASGGTEALKNGHLFYLLKVLSPHVSFMDGKLETNPTHFESRRIDAETKLTVEGAYVEGEVQLRPYDDDVYCLTDECLINSVELYNSKPIPGVPLSREDGFMVLFALPGLVLIFALLALGCTVCGKTCTPPLVLCSCLLAPFLFLIVGVAGVPILLVFSDVCDNLEPLLINTVSTLQPKLCVDFGMNLSQTNEKLCTLELQEGWEVEVDLEAVVVSFVSECTGKSVANAAPSEEKEPIAQLWRAIQSGVPEVVDTMVEQFLTESLNGTTLQPDAELLLDDLVDEAKDTFDGLITGVSETLDCEAISSLFDGLIDPVCCNFRTSLFWLIMPWVLIAMFIFICIFPIICCAGRKRKHFREVCVEDA